MRTPVHLSKTFRKLHLLHINLSSAQSVVYTLWEEVPKLVYYRLICKPVCVFKRVISRYLTHNDEKNIILISSSLYTEKKMRAKMALLESTIVDDIMLPIQRQ